MKRFMILVLIALCAACGGKATPKAAPTVFITVTATPTHHAKPKPTTLSVRPVMVIHKTVDGETQYEDTEGVHCKGINSSSAYHVNAGITVYNASGARVIGTAFVTKSTVIDGDCYLVGEVRDLPIEAFYQVQFAGGNKIAFSQHALLTQSETTVIS